ncbi:hypothetical protein B5S30_g2997 [[Candida] boidinii]|nr:hypothetical protein B5S30_g2997 [[Candida] boidinii]
MLKFTTITARSSGSVMPLVISRFASSSSSASATAEANSAATSTVNCNESESSIDQLSQTEPQQQQQQPQTPLLSVTPTEVTHGIFSTNNSTSISTPIPSKSSNSLKKKYLDSLPRVPTTEHLNENGLLIDMLMNGYRPLSSPVLINHTRSPVLMSLNPRSLRKRGKPNLLHEPHKKPTTILENLATFKETKNSIHSSNKKRSSNYNPYFSQNDSFIPYNSIFTNTILNTQQHNTELFNLPLHYIQKLKPFQCSNKPGQELYRDDSIVVRKIESEEKLILKRRQRLLKLEDDLKSAKDGKLKTLKIENIEEFFGFK